MLGPDPSRGSEFFGVNSETRLLELAEALPFARSLMALGTEGKGPRSEAAEFVARSEGLARCCNPGEPLPLLLLVAGVKAAADLELRRSLAMLAAELACTPSRVRGVGVGSMRHLLLWVTV